MDKAWYGNILDTELPHKASIILSMYLSWYDTYLDIQIDVTSIGMGIILITTNKAYNSAT